jgi:molybdate transport repressor ModE-like protein
MMLRGSMANPRNIPLDVTRLRLLREVALRGSIAAAARAVGLTPSAVSQQLTVLEREAGVALLDRSPRGVFVTGAGQSLVDRTHQILQLLEGARSDLEQLSGEVSGNVRIGTVASAAASIVSAAATALAQSHPQIELSVLVAEPQTAIDDLIANDLDLALVDVYDGVPVPVPDYLIATELCTEPLVVVSAPGYFGPTSPIPLAMLADQRWVMPPQTAACGQAVRFACRAQGFEPQVSWETDDMLLLVRAVAAGHGVAVLPRLAVADSVAAVDLLTLDRPSMNRQLLVLSRSSGADRPVVQAAVNMLAKAAAVGLLTPDSCARITSTCPSSNGADTALSSTRHSSSLN